MAITVPPGMARRHVVVVEQPLQGYSFGYDGTSRYRMIAMLRNRHSKHEPRIGNGHTQFTDWHALAV